MILDTITPPSRKPRWNKGYRTMPGLGRVPTEELVARIRRFRGRKTVSEILDALGIPRHRYSWSSIRKLCRDYQIVTADPDDPDYYPRTVQRDEKALREQDQAEEREAKRAAECEKIRAVLRQQIALAHAEWSSAPPYKVGALEW